MGTKTVRRAVVIILALLIVIGGVGGVVGEMPSLVLAAVGLGLLCMSAALMIRLAAIGRRLDEQDVLLREVRKSVGRGPGSLAAKIRHDTIRDVSALLFLHSVTPPEAPGVPLTNYSALPETAELLRDRVSRLPDGALVVEVGSGATTLWMALAIAANERRVRIVSLESSAEWCEVTRSALARNGVAHLVDLRCVSLSTDSDGVVWYDSDGWIDLDGIDLLFVNGPPGSTAPDARLPVVERLGPRMDPRGHVVVDDVNRPDEKRMVSAWAALDSGGGWREVERRERVVVLARRS